MKEAFGEIEFTAVEGSGGVFEITVDDSLVFSKKALGRFPAYQEIPTQIQMG